MVGCTLERTFKYLACVAAPRCDLSVKRSVARVDGAKAVEVAHILQLGAISEEGWLRKVAVWCTLTPDFTLSKGDGLPEVTVKVNVTSGNLER